MKHYLKSFAFLVSLSIIFIQKGFNQEVLIQPIPLDQANSDDDILFDIIDNNLYLTVHTQKDPGKLVLEKHNAQFEIDYQTRIQIPEGFTFAQHCLTKDYLFLMFVNADNELLFYQTDATFFDVKKTLSTSIPHAARVPQIYGLGTNIFAHVTIDLYKDMLLKIDFTHNTIISNPIEIPNFNSNKFNIDHAAYYPQTEELCIFLYGKPSTPKNIFAVMYNASGIQTTYFNFFEATQQICTNIEISPQGDSQYVITGNYASDNYISPAGIFIMVANGSKVTHFHTYNYGLLNKFFTYHDGINLPKNYSPDTSANTNHDLKLHYNIASSPVSKFGDMYIFVAEAYYPVYGDYKKPVYITNTYSSDARNMLKGYKTTHASIIAFDTNGNMLWNTPIQVKSDKKSAKHQPSFIVNPESDFIYVEYASDTDIESFIVSPLGSVSKNTSVSINSEGIHNDLIAENYFVKHWSNHNYVTFGYKRVSTTEGLITHFALQYQAYLYTID